MLIKPDIIANFTFEVLIKERKTQERLESETYEVNVSILERLESEKQEDYEFELEKERQRKN